MFPRFCGTPTRSSNGPLVFNPATREVIGQDDFEDNNFQKMPTGKAVGPPK
ncbi:MAG: hypothetical protein QNL33_01245 [Akkermansiaceae bacterium]